MSKVKVYFCKEISEANIVKMYEALGIKLEGKVGLKLHSGEPGNFNFLPASFYQPIVEKLNATVIECNTAYEGGRNYTDRHVKTLMKHKFSEMYNVDIMDANYDEKDIELDIPNGKIIKKDYIGNHAKNYDSCLVVCHFKGHPMGGYGGALKQLSIGFASTAGKSYIHSAGKTKDQVEMWNMLPEPEIFVRAMADAAYAVADYYKDRIAYISVLKNMSVDCDCIANPEPPCLKDIGILASLDPVAIDKAAFDLIKASNDPGYDHFMERVNSLHGLAIFDACKQLGFGNEDYELIEIK